MLAEESWVATHKKLQKLMKKSAKIEQKWVGNTAFDLNSQGITQKLADSSANINHISHIPSIGYHRLTIG